MLISNIMESFCCILKMMKIIYKKSGQMKGQAYEHGGDQHSLCCLHYKLAPSSIDLLRPSKFHNSWIHRSMPPLVHPIFARQSTMRLFFPTVNLAQAPHLSLFISMCLNNKVKYSVRLLITILQPKLLTSSFYNSH